MIKLQFLVNHFRETTEIVGRLLNSIAAQNGIIPEKDYGVIICNDGCDNVLDETFLSSFPFKIEYRVMPRRGVCATRNALLDMANAEYVMFCDADDCFCSPNGAAALLHAAENADVVASAFYKEVKTKDGFSLKKARGDVPLIHGKLYRLTYLLENDIRFPDEIQTAGDMSFVWQTVHMTNRFRRLAEPVYVWKWNGRSVTHSQRGAELRANMITSYALLAEKMVRRQRKDLHDEIISTLISAAYLDFTLDNWNEGAEPVKQAAIEFVRKFRSAYNSLDREYRFKAYNRALLMKRTYGPTSGFQGVQDWLKEV